MDTLDLLTLLIVMISLAAIPSSSVALVLARSATSGIRNGIAVATGIVLGDLVFVLLAILGLNAIAELMGSFFVVLKVVGGLYLIWIGITLLQSNGLNFDPGKVERKSNGLVVSFAAGFFLTLGDIKAIIFYASLFPFFIDLNSASLTDYALVIGVTIISVGSVKILYAIFASRIAQYAHKKQLSDTPRKMAGGLMVGVGSYVVLKP